MPTTIVKVGDRGLYVEGPGYTPMPCVITHVFDPAQFGGKNYANCVITLDGNYVAQEGWSNEEIAALHSWRTSVTVLQPGEPREFPCIFDVR